VSEGQFPSQTAGESRAGPSWPKTLCNLHSGKGLRQSNWDREWYFREVKPLTLPVPSQRIAR